MDAGGLGPLGQFLLDLVIIERAAIPIQGGQSVVILESLGIILDNITELRVIPGRERLGEIHAGRLAAIRPGTVHRVHDRAHGAATGRAGRHRRVIIRQLHSLDQQIRGRMHQLLLFLVNLVFCRNITGIPVMFRPVHGIRVPVRERPAYGVQILTKIDRLILVCDLGRVIGQRLVDIRLAGRGVLARVQIGVNRKRLVILHLQNLARGALAAPPGHVLGLDAHTLQSLDRATVPIRHVQIGGVRRHGRQQQQQDARHSASGLP